MSVFLDITPDLQRERILNRNPDFADRFFNEWIPLEQKYFSEMQIKQRCTMSVTVE